MLIQGGVEDIKHRNEHFSHYHPSPGYGIGHRTDQQLWIIRLRPGLSEKASRIRAMKSLTFFRLETQLKFAIGPTLIPLFVLGAKYERL